MNSRRARSILALALATGPLTTAGAAQALPTSAPPVLKAESANTKEVQLSWSGAPVGSCSLQRKMGPPPESWPVVAASSDGKAVDSKIAAYGTYVYRVMCGTKTSNEVTVGPPPAGFHTIASRPDNRPDTALGKFISPVLDANGDPAAAFVYNDPNGDGRGEDTEVMFVAWDRAGYRWKTPVMVATAANFDPRPPAPCLAVTRDLQSGAYGIAWLEAGDNRTVHMAVSHDGGATWVVKTAFSGTTALGGPNLVFARGKAHLTVEQDSKQTVFYLTGDIDEDPAQWNSTSAPMLSGNNGVTRANSLAVDEQGAPGLAYWQKANNASIWSLAFWRPNSSAAPVKVADTGMSNYPPDGVILTFAGLQPRVMVDSRLDRAEISSHYSVISNDGGATWSKPLPVPDDGNEHIGGYMSLAVAKDGQAAFAGDVIGGNTDRMKCSWPKVARSSDFSQWATCAPQGAQYPMIRTLWGSVIYSPSGVLYAVFQNRQVNPQQGLPAGLLIWGGK